MLSVVFSATDEVNNPFFWQSLIILSNSSNIEAIVVINTALFENTSKKISQQYPNIKIIHTDSNSRAVRLNKGMLQAKHQLIIFQHPRSILSDEAYQYILDSGEKLTWGAFEHQFDFSHPVLAFTSWYSNQIRFKKSNIAYLDHCIFINKAKFNQASLMIPSVDIFEDTLLSKQLSREHKPSLLPYQAITSSIRFKKNGVLRQSLLNQLLKIGYHVGVDHKTMNKLYEKGLSLNSSYKKNNK